MSFPVPLMHLWIGAHVLMHNLHLELQNKEPVHRPFMDFALGDSAHALAVPSAVYQANCVADGGLACIPLKHKHPVMPGITGCCLSL
jgi:hypothetical protein